MTNIKNTLANPVFGAICLGSLIHFILAFTPLAKLGGGGIYNALEKLQLVETELKELPTPWALLIGCSTIIASIICLESTLDARKKMISMVLICLITLGWTPVLGVYGIVWSPFLVVASALWSGYGAVFVRKFWPYVVRSSSKKVEDIYTIDGSTTV